MERVVLLMTKEMKERLAKEAEADRRSISNYIITHYIEKTGSQTQTPAAQGLEEVKIIEKEIVKEVDSVVSKLPKPVLDFYEQILYRFHKQLENYITVKNPVNLPILQTERQVILLWRKCMQLGIK